MSNGLAPESASGFREKVMRDRGVSEREVFASASAFETACKDNDHESARTIMKSDAYHAYCVIEADKEARHWSGIGGNHPGMRIALMKSASDKFISEAKHKLMAARCRELGAKLVEVQRLADDANRRVNEDRSEQADIIRMLRDEVRDLKASLLYRIQGAEKRLEDFGYQGVFVHGRKYAVGNLVTFGGSIFHCNVEQAGSKPGDDSGCWTLAVQRGRDGKDVR